MPDATLMVGSPPPKAEQVTLENWRTPPFNRWAFQHVCELIPSAVIWRGEGAVLEMESAPRDVMSICFTNHAGAPTRVDEYLAATQTDGFAVLHRGRLITERYFNALKPHQPHILMSVSKSLTSTLAGIFVSRGLLDPSQSVTGLVPEVRGSAFEDCSLQHILDMTVWNRI